MNEKIRNTISIMKDKYITNKIKKIQNDFMKKKNRMLVGVVGVLALAMVLSITPMVNMDTPLEIADKKIDQGKSIAIEQNVNDTQWLINIGGKLALAVEKEEDAKAVFEGLKSYYLTEGSEVDNIGFGQSIEFEEYDYKTSGGEPAWVMSVDEAINYIIKGTSETKSYIVQGGDTIWDIAIKNDMTPEELEQMNPGITSSTLKIGSTLNLFELKPLVTITTTETVLTTEVVPYKTIYEETSDMYRGQSKVKIAGETGSKQVTSKIVKQNGVVLSSEVIDEQVLSEPHNQIALKGTEAIPAYTGSGDGILSAPMSHIEVSSPFGVSRGYRRHMGVDLRNPKGTVISSASDGVVIFAGYSGSYGNIVKVDHGGGLQTYYAHCDSIYVSVGENITKGQAIATVGRTGNATGNILHFEVRVNGVAKNPMNYI